MDILNYVCGSLHFAAPFLTSVDASLRNGLLGHSSKSVKRPSSGDSGPAIPTTRMTKPGPDVKRRKLRTIFSTPLRSTSE